MVGILIVHTDNILGVYTEEWRDGEEERREGEE
jgi:hypothetical protein